MTDKIFSITNKTLVPISFIGVIAYCIFFISELKAKTDHHEQKLNQVSINDEKFCEKLENISIKLSRIEGILSNINEKK